MFLIYNAHLCAPDLLDPRITALAIEGSCIVALGTDAEILESFPAGSEKLNLGGKTILPGLIDSHLHLHAYGQYLNQIDCETKTLEECLNRLAERANCTPSGEWILGHGWNKNIWPNGFGCAADLDSITLQHPVYLTDKALHTGWANSLALQIAGISKQTPDPKGGTIQRDPSGNPTGILFENAVRLVESVIPPPTDAQRRKTILAAQQALLQYGITSVCDFDKMDGFPALHGLDQEEKLHLRVCKGIPLLYLEEAINLHIKYGEGSDHLWFGPIKCFADGALGPQTAAMFAPYEGSESNYGTLLLTPEDVFEIGRQVVPHGFPLAIHAIGDKAVHQVVEGYEKLREFEQQNDLPHLDHRIEHAQLLRPEDMRKLAQMKVIASMQPIHATSDMEIADKYWGQRSRYAYLFKSIIQSGINVIFGSDAPVESPNPFPGIHAAVTRCKANSNKSWHPEECISLDQAIAAFTSTPGMIISHKQRIGQLNPGCKADLIILEEDPFTLSESELYTIKPTSVMIDGKWIINNN